ncbi:DUF885 domain-containing protein [Pseudoalteromonas tunicata]|uniref:Lipoprotein n=1 Tax=Pseudoalteromonas tunicata D2 TaxID=87626 RepID=A4CF55_9GAMM|nr:DUF885 domain-containing protein [Pseudoalteromonas tunicata]ATC96238.1 hypothetical protein PTUN_a3997 [Pseudoalteromonas tunicata]AXT31751.1 DUF885 domain-containing protein [Pseudoalteromonas tunicata]EAR26603.1 hypothetical protein PTD2_00302 [Pseudoalteromonas tunicata D2]
MIKTIKHSLIAIGCAVALSACVTTQKLSVDAQFTTLAEQVVAYRKSIDPFAQNGAVNGHYLADLSPEFLAQTNAKREAFVQQLELLESTELSSENRINLAILKAQIQNNIDEYKFNAHYMPLTSEFGFHSELSFMVARSDFSTKAGYELYLQRLADVPRYFNENIHWMKEGIKIGLTQPKVVLQGYESSIAALINQDIESSEFYSPFKNQSLGLTADELAEFRLQATKVIREQVNPALEQYYQFFVNEYYPAAREQIGISTTPNGADFYANRAKYFTTTDMTVEQIHQLGLSEVARIRKEMEAIIKSVNFNGSFADFIHFLRTDPQFYATTPEALLKEASYIAKKMDAQLPKLFNHLPRIPYGVAPVPQSIAPKYTTGRYVGPNRDDQPGYYWVNTYGLDKRPLYVLEALTLHEAVPGHHLQISLNSELTHLPDYRRDSYISAFGEGWGLYSEWLGIEAGFYQNPYSNFGRLTYEMWRAARLVVDTGMHMYGWSREKAMAFMQDNTALSLHNVKTETDRYISWPGQALSYKVGELTIKRLRQQVETALGEHFDVREFHNQILKNGSVPLFVLEQQIEQYIKEEKTKLKG